MPRLLCETRLYALYINVCRGWEFCFIFFKDCFIALRCTNVYMNIFDSYFTNDTERTFMKRLLTELCSIKLHNWNFHRTFY